MNYHNSGNNQTALISTDHKRGFELETPLPKTDHIDRFTKLFPAKKSISLWDVFNQINQATKFIDAFEPFDFHRNKKRPDAIYFYAALIERTTRNGFDKIVKQVGDIDKDQLEDTARIFLTSDNVRRANARVTSFIDELEIASIPETGVCQYSFEDKDDLFRHPKALCCSEIEFAYAIDRLLGNASAPIEEDDILIKDKRACRELLFGIADLLGYSYVTRITDFSEYNFYGNEEYKGENFKVDDVINYDLINANWDEILRFVATIKTGYTSAAVLIPKFINRFEDPMFMGLREAGKLIQTLFILKYIDKVELRQTIERHLDKAQFHVGLSKFIQKPQRASEFISFNDKEFNDACASLLKNCIMAWNFDYLATKKQDIADFSEILKHGFVPYWKHIAFSHR